MSYRKTQIRRRFRAGFTLTELLVVIAIIGLLSGVVTVGMRGYLASSRLKLANTELTQIVSALENYNSLKSAYPTQAEGLAVLTASTDEFPGGLLNGNINDPWGNPYEYAIPGTNNEPFDVICSGPDGRFGSADDIASFELETQ